MGLYIHIPWCIRKCPYCDFNSHESGRAALPEADYGTALLRDLDTEIGILAASDTASQREICSVFIGGGTPSLLSGEFYARLFDEIRRRVDIADDAEVTLEANPGTGEQADFKGFRRAGINRLSIGVQSFDNDALQMLGRIHDADAARATFNAVREAGFDNINLDLMYGLQGQDTRSAIKDIEHALLLSPEHISWYQLTIEPNTAFYSQPPLLPGDDQLAEIEAAGCSLLQENGYTRYEISAYAKPGRQSMHNLNYWRFGDYLGIGAGAHGKLTPGDRVVRRHKIRQPKSYMHNANQLAGEKVIDREEMPLEFMLNALRLTDGFELQLFRERTGLSIATVEDRLHELVRENLLREVAGGDNARIAPTERGLLFHNELVARFMTI